MSGAEPREGREVELGWWLALLALLAFVAYLQAYAGSATVRGERPPGDRMELVFQARYVLGVHEMGSRFGRDRFTPGSADAADLLGTFESGLETPRERLTAVAVNLAVGNGERAQTQLDGVRWTLGRGGEDGASSMTLAQVDRFQALLDGRRLDGEDRQRLLDEYGWFAQLALAGSAEPHDQAQPEGGDLAALLSKAERLALVVTVAFVIGMLLVILGSGLLVVGFAMYSRGQLRSGYLDSLPPPSSVLAAPSSTSDPESSPGPTLAPVAVHPSSRVPYLQTVVIFVLAVQVVGAVAATLMIPAGADSVEGFRPGEGATWPLMLQWLVLLVLAWPLRKGRSVGELRTALGLGPGAFRPREVLAGIVAYLSAMPILACGLVASMIVSRFTSSQPYHPVVDWASTDDLGSLAMVMVLAVIWAPIVEEGVFRGSFYHYLRGRLGVLPSAVLVGLVFAGLHPQGIAGVPFLLSLAVVLALVREWRGSLVASITVHAVHNGLAMALILVLFGAG